MTDADEHAESKLTEQEEAIAYRVIWLFLQQRQRGPDGKSRRSMTADDVAEQISREFGTKMNRQGVYRQLGVAMDHGLIRPVPPLSTSLAQKVTELYNLDANSIHVVHALAGETQDAGRSWIGEQVARHGAERVLALVKEVGKSRPPQSKSPVAIGVGPGRATQEWATHFSQLVRSEPDLPELELIAITAGGDPEHSEFLPTSFFSLFPRSRVKCVGLYAPTLIRDAEIGQYFTLDPGFPGVVEALRRRERIDIVVSSMGDPQDDHDLLTRYLRSAGAPIPADAVGNVQYRYYNEHGPIREKPQDLRAFTLFELENFREIASRRNGHVVLMARTCALCNRSRAQALRPLLMRPELKLWTEISMDVKTATELIAMAPSR